MRGKPRNEYKSDEKDIGDREAFKWSANTDAPGEANWYKSSKSYWTERFARDNDGVSVEEEIHDPNSLLNHYRRLLKLRATNPALRSGTQHVIAAPSQILAVERSSMGEHLLILANLSASDASFHARGKDLLSGNIVRGSLRLAPYQATIIRR